VSARTGGEPVREFFGTLRADFGILCPFRSHFRDVRAKNGRIYRGLLARPKRFELLTPRFVVCGRCDKLSFNGSNLTQSLYRSSGLFSGLRNPFERRYKFVIKNVRIARGGFDVSVIKRALYEL
jgi:hypothetical protein